MRRVRLRPREHTHAPGPVLPAHSRSAADANYGRDGAGRDGSDRGAAVLRAPPGSPGKDAASDAVVPQLQTTGELCARQASPPVCGMPERIRALPLRVSVHTTAPAWVQASTQATAPLSCRLRRHHSRRRRARRRHSRRCRPGRRHSNRRSRHHPSLATIAQDQDRAGSAAGDVGSSKLNPPAGGMPAACAGWARSRRSRGRTPMQQMRRIQEGSQVQGQQCMTQRRYASMHACDTHAHTAKDRHCPHGGM